MKLIYKTMMLLVLPFASIAQNNTDTITINKLDEVVISANKSEDKKSDLIQQVNVITSKDISQSNAQSTATLIENSGNAFVQKSQAGGGSISIRGFEASRVVMMIDGVRMNNLIYRAGHLQNIITIDNNILDRIEILNGPSSTIYGSDALGGVVNMYTRKPILSQDKKDLIKGNVSFRYGSVNNERTGHGEFNYGTKKFASLTSLTYSKFGDMRMGSEQNPFYPKFGERNFYVDRIDNKDSLVANINPLVQKYSGYTQYDILQKFLVQQNDYITHQLNVQYSNSSNVPRYDRLTDPKGAGLNSAEWYYGPQTRVMTAYDFNYKKPGALFDRVHAGVNYQYIEESRHSRGFGSSKRSNREEYVDVLGYSIDFTKIINKQNIRFGIDGQYSTVHSTAYKTNIKTGQEEPLDTRYPNGKNNMNNIALYATHTGKLGKHFTLNDGIRIGYTTLHAAFEDTLFFNFPFTEVNQKNLVLSGNLGLIYAPTDKWKIGLMASTGFRAPNIEDMTKVFESAPGTLIVPNDKIKPEKTLNAELNISKFFGNSVRWENAIWATYFIDAIQAAPFQYNGLDTISYGGSTSNILANQNVGKAYLFGYSTSIVADFSNHFGASGSFSYTRGRVFTDSTDAPLDHVAPIFGRVGFNYHSPKVFAEIYTIFNGWKHLEDYSASGEDNLNYATADGMPAWYTLNVKASYQAHKNIALMAGIENIFGTQYRTFASGINAPGRNLYATLKVSW